MEAIANYAFSPTEPDELGFEKGSTLCVVGMEEDPNWYKARQGNQEGMVPANYISLYPHPWYIPKCSRREAEARLLETDPNTHRDVQPDGAFILRQSENDPGHFSISVKEGSSVLHFRIFFDPSGKYYIWTNKFSSVNALIDYHRHQTIYGLKALLLRDCVSSKIFGSVGCGPNMALSSPIVQTNTACRGSHLQASDVPALCIKEHPHVNASLPPGVVCTNLSGRHCVAKFDFDAEFREEMSFRRGDRLRLLGEEDENWWFAELLTRAPGSHPSSHGLIPANYVELLSNSTPDSIVPNIHKIPPHPAQVARAN
ncbi:hypothetical protein MN116_000165 [Schistosoma mekongi]|uniref:Growth factor receptor-bound protein 2 n=2 Tax=Schistosoma mekongi TaxID=38744 RepID=A0AAE2D7M7_SCHME|nr:hypothetical protein MN116_000165 [Schistosoma mekongi]